MAQGQRTPGPLLLYALFRGETLARFLGTAIQAPEPEGEKFKLEVFNDLSGRSVPFQLVQDGEKWYVMFSMNRFNYTLVQNIRALESGVPVTPGLASIPTGLGSETGIARGTLSIGVTDWQLLVLNSYAGTTSAGQFVGGIGASDMPSGRLFYSCNMRKYKESTEGTRVLEVAMAVECQNVFNPSATLVNRGFQLYTEDATKFPNIAAFE